MEVSYELYFMFSRFRFFMSASLTNCKDGTLDIFGKSSDKVFLHFNIGGLRFTQPTFQPIYEHSLDEQDDTFKVLLGDPNGDKIPSFISYNKVR